MQLLSVSSLTAYLGALLESDEVLGDVWVQGEVSNWSRSSAGHCYWTMREGDAQIRTVCFRKDAERQPTMPANGDAILAHGRVAFWEGSGHIQFYVDLLRPAGVGILHAQLEALKQRLQADGLFDEARKRPIPAFPRRIGIVTSPTGAALQDMLAVLARRWPASSVLLAPALVQGEDAPSSLVDALFNLFDHMPDLIIVARGGGSVEDLWAFNDESVARAVFASPVPVITGVGHETDTTLVDYVADLRAATPTAAAVLATPDIEELADDLVALRVRLRESMEGRLQDARDTLEDQQARLVRLSPRAQLVDGQLRLDQWAGRLRRAIHHQIALKERDVLGLEYRLAALSPGATLARGYAIARHADGRVVTTADAVAAGDMLVLDLHDGTLTATVTGVEAASKKGRKKPS
jgi:exodeoxyribonuclease VII large subunit